MPKDVWSNITGSAMIILTLLIACTKAYGDNPNMPRDGDVLNVVKLPTAFTGESGRDVTWHFSDTEEGESLKMSFSVDSDTARCTWGGTAYSYLVSGDTLSLTGFENRTTLAGFSTPEFSLLLPLNYGDSIGRIFDGNIVYSQKVRLSVSGYSRSTTDGTGILCIGEDTIPGVTRVHRHSEMTSTVCDSLSACPLSENAMQDEYMYFAKGYRYPVLTTATVRTADSATSAYTLLSLPEWQTYDLLADEVNEALRETEDTGNDAGTPEPAGAVSIYEAVYNPDGSVTIRYGVSAACPLQIVVSDVYGQPIWNSSYIKSPGEYEDRITLPTGANAVVITIRSADSAVTEKIRR